MRKDLLQRLREFGDYGGSEESRLMAEAATALGNVVVLIGTNTADGHLIVVGLYESGDAASEAVHSGNLPTAHYSIMTPPWNGCLQSRDAGMGWPKPLSSESASDDRPA